MNKKGNLVILGIPVAALLWFFFSFIVIDPVVDEMIDEVADLLGDDNYCPPEFEKEGYRVCLDAEGNIFVDGILDSNISLQIDGFNDVCYIQAGNYNFEYSGCQLDKFKQISAYNLILVSKTGKITIKGTTIIKKITAGTGIVKISKFAKVLNKIF